MPSSAPPSPSDLGRRPAAAATLALVAMTALTAPLVGGAAQAAIVPEPVSVTADDAAFELTAIGTYESGIFDASAAEIVTFHAATQRLFVVNAAEAKIDVLDLADPASPTLLHEITAPGTASADGTTIPGGAVANSVAVREDGLGVIAVEHPTSTEPGWLAVFDAAGDGGLLGAVRVGALPDMVAVNAAGTYAVVANEGEPADDFSVDPEGSVSVVTLPETLTAPSQEDVRTADFHAWDDGSRTLHEDVRVFGPTPHGADLPVSRNLEPEYVAIDADDTTAYAALQEANAIAVVDLATATVTDIWPLGFKDHSLEGNGLDPSDRDPRDAPTIDIRTFPGLKGIYQPDGIESYAVGGETYLVTANEGDAREFGDYVESVRAKHLGDPDETPAPPVCEDAPVAQYLDDENLGRLNVSIANGLTEDGSCFEELYAFGARSMSIWTTDGEQVFDSGDEFERITAAANPEFFNSNHSESNLEGRSEDKGPEPENLAIGEVDGRTYAFVGLERVGGVVAYDITEPAEATFVTYLNNRDFSVSMEDVVDAEPGEDAVTAALSQAGDLGPEGLTFIPAAASGNGLPLVVVGNEVSGTTTIFAVGQAVEEVPDEEPTTPTAPDDGTDAGTDAGEDTGNDAGDDTAPVTAPTADADDAAAAAGSDLDALPETGAPAAVLAGVSGLLVIAGGAIALTRRFGAGH